MKIVLLTPTPPDINAFGVRIMSSVLKKAGYPTKVIFLPGGIQHLRFDGGFVYQYSEKTLAQIAELCRDADLIGISLMSQYFDRAVQVSEYLKSRFKAPIIWGGIHPTYRPEQCLEHCDAVCIGEGEYAVIDLANRIAKNEDYSDIKSCWFKVKGKIIKNEQGPIIENLDELPYIDFDLEDHYVYEWRSEDIIPIDDEIMKKQFLRTPFFKERNLITYRTMTSRGCPHRCSYCASSAMMRLRRRSVENVIDELKTMLKKFTYIEIISFFDDTFFIAPVEYFEEFRDKYKKEIGLPFHAQCSPTTLTRQKMNILVDAGLYHTEMGIQTGSERIKKMYRRSESNQKIIEAAALISSYSSRMLPPYYHIILDNPWETTEDIKDTVKLVLKLPGKFKFSISSLILFPGTELNEKARKEGVLKDELNEVCRKPFTFPKGTYLNYLIYLAGFPAVSRYLLRFLSLDIFVKLFYSQRQSRFYDFLFNATNKTRVVIKGVGALLRGDWGRIINYLKLAR